MEYQNKLADQAATQDSKDRVAEVGRLIEEIAKHNISIQDLLTNLRTSATAQVPASIFRNRDFAPIDILIKHMHEENRLDFGEISGILSRPARQIQEKYSAIQNKPTQKAAESIKVPATIFGEPGLSILEHLVEYLKEKHRMRHSEIARLIDRDVKTVWTLYARAKDKRIKGAAQ